MFKGRTLLIVTKHKKEKVMAPILEKELGVICITTENFNTDDFGTFSGEIERKYDPITTVRNKCLKAMQLFNCDLAVASEGSFGQHPEIFFAPSDDELLIFIDKKNNIEILARELSTNTNFKGSEIDSEIDLIKFANDAKFPSHALILRKSKVSNVDVFKGITTTLKLKKYFKILMDKYGNVYIETDMRAMYNPTRMKVIESTTKKLLKKIKSQCPSCKAPGYSVIDAKPGLLCKNCGAPTRSILLHIFSCQTCNFSQEKLYPHSKTSEDPMYCDFCNP